MHPKCRRFNYRGIRVLTQQQLRDILSYNPKTGVLIWRQRENIPKEWNTRWAGKVAGSVNSAGYLIITLNTNERYLVHRIIWLLMTGKWPKNEIDHVDNNRINNRWENLREATRIENSRNRPFETSSGVIGVSWHKQRNKWRARITVNRKEIHLGYFLNFNEAVKVRKDAENKYFGEFIFCEENGKI